MLPNMGQAEALTHDGSATMSPVFSPDGSQTKDGVHSLWSARVDHMVPPRALTSNGDELSPVFTPQGDLLFMSHAGEESFLYKMKPDGSERRKIYRRPVIQLETISPDGRWAVAQAEIENEDVPWGILAIPLEGGTPFRICSGLCVVRWPMNGKTMILAVIGGSNRRMLGWGTYIVPLPPDRPFPQLPPMGVASKEDAAALSGAKFVGSFVLPGENEEIYAFSRTTVHRNLFQIPVP